MRGVEELGLSGWTVRIGDTGLLNRVLDAHGLSDATKGFVFAHMDELKTGSTSVDDLVGLAEDMGLVRARDSGDAAPVATENGAEVTRQFVRDMLSDSVSSPVGRRTTEQIVERLLRKLQRADSPDKLAGALALWQTSRRSAARPTRRFRRREIFSGRTAPTQRR